MEEFLNFFLSLLEKELRLQKELLELARQKKKFLLQNRMEELVGILEKEGELVCQAREVETKMKRVWKEAVHQLGLEPEEFSISRLVKLSDQGRGKKFLDLQSDLQKTLWELRELNEQNALIIRDTLNYIEIMFSILFRHFDTQGKSYGPFGQVSNGGSCGIIINGVV